MFAQTPMATSLHARSRVSSFTFNSEALRTQKTEQSPKIHNYLLVDFGLAQYEQDAVRDHYSSFQLLLLINR